MDWRNRTPIPGVPVARAFSKSLMDLHPRELKGVIKDIPTLPVIYQELFRKMQDPDVSVPAIAEIITRDQAISAKVLHLVNSAFYGYANHINTISRAVVILGFQAVRSAALATSVFDFFKEEDGQTCQLKKFWEHSIATASICKALAPRLNINQAEEAFVVGLLHDVGKLIEKHYFSTDFDEVCKAAQELHLSWYDCEKALFQTNHAGIGKTVFREWQFPPGVVEAVQHHHDPSAATKVPHLTALVHVADFLSYELDYGAPGAWPPKECDPLALRTLGTTLDECRQFMPAVTEEILQAMEILKILEPVPA